MTGLDAQSNGSERVVRLAEWLADPAGWFSGDDGLPGDQRATLAASALLRPALNRYLGEQIGTVSLGFDAGFLAALASDDEMARAAALATAPEEELHRCTQFFGAAMCHDGLRMALLRSERDRLTALLGPEAVGFGLRRAPLVARALHSLPLASSDDPLAAGRTLCVSLIGHASPALYAMFRLRRPDFSEPVVLTDVQARAGWAVRDAVWSQAQQAVPEPVS